ncbi:hypothetical protein CfE428DRAFT_0454 [Chthoniobacter flavus Ellin428]|uniref:Uncharacterized protein n=1 Tax=Chthoniobacter flavus Ellin428 TaxID=497964 RepID=B4CUU1_9BACT|nr:hypothetical protein [Chthoniobacter flavus]EDY22329.1 hypothetical protein CfE428DRAFT_0454 [Chthoniobacter flavus Ellin428]TCO94658.1 hypothetical protein EV701_102125 [Chthoniobacter flavus]
MLDPSSSPIPPELQVLLDLELTIQGLNSAVAQQRLETALADISGMESLSFFEGKLAIRYEPEKVTRTQIFERIGAAGFQIAAAESAPPSPPVVAQ